MFFGLLILYSEENLNQESEIFGNISCGIRTPGFNTEFHFLRFRGFGMIERRINWNGRILLTFGFSNALCGDCPCVYLAGAERRSVRVFNSQFSTPIRKKNISMLRKMMFGIGQKCDKPIYIVEQTYLYSWSGRPTKNSWLRFSTYII